MAVKLFSSLLNLVLIFLLINSIKSENLKKLIAYSKEIMIRDVSSNCQKIIRQNNTCTSTFKLKYPNDDEKSLCCFMYHENNCLEDLILNNCEEMDYKVFLNDEATNIVFKNIQEKSCLNYPNIDSCYFPIKKTLIISGSIFLAITIILSAVLYHRHKTGFRKINPNAV